MRASLPGCGAKGTCTSLNLCGACTPYADCTEALAAAPGTPLCHHQAPDGCGGTMDCGGGCEAGKTCLYTSYANGNGYWACLITCSGDADCPAPRHWCEEGYEYFSNESCQDGRCTGIAGRTECRDGQGNPAFCVDGKCPGS